MEKTGAAQEGNTNHGVRLSPSFDSNLLRHDRIKLSLAQSLREIATRFKKWGPRGSLILLSTLTFCGAAQVVHGMLWCVSLIEAWLQFCTAIYGAIIMLPDWPEYEAEDAHYCTMPEQSV